MPPNQAAVRRLLNYFSGRKIAKGWKILILKKN
jgi:hypothetical protein